LGKSYFEKLKDPRWQKKRLEALSLSNFCCESCADSTSTLHVHHKQYFKVREPWDYEVDQLAVLCESCHESTHETEDSLLLATSYVPIDGRDSVASLIAGFVGKPMNSEFVNDPDLYVDGHLANAIGRLAPNSLTILEKIKLAELAVSDRSRLTAHLRAFLGDCESTVERGLDGDCA